MSRVRERLLEYKLQLEKQTLYKEKLPGSSLDIINSLLNDLEEDAKENGWISVNERMPEEHDSIFAKFKGTGMWSRSMFEKHSKDVLVTVEYPDGERNTETAHTIDGKWRLEAHVLNGTVIAWKPFPEPCKRGTRNHETD